MYKNLRWKVLIIVAVAALAVWAFYPPDQKVRLGLDLKGGVHLVLQVKTDDALKVETETAAEQLREALKTANIPYKDGPVGLTDFTLEAIPAPNDGAFRQAADTQVSASFDRQQSGPGAYRFTMRPNIVVRTRADAVTQALQTIERRVNELGVSEPIVSTYGSTGDQIVVQLPGVTDIAEAKRVIQNTARLEMRLVEGGPASDQATLLTPHGGQLPPGMEILPGSGDDPANPGTFFYLMRSVPAITGNDLRNARPTVDEFNLPAVSFTLKSEGSAKFSKVTAANVGRRLAIVLDGRVRSAPTIEGPIPSTEARITGSFTQQEVSELSLILRSGALPASLTYLEERTVGPTLGQDSIRSGVQASLVGLVLVTVFMLGYYKLAGFNALISVSLNLIILLGFMAYLGAVMTLPGIAGFILTIGMGVDSNVLIFERIREELATKKSARQALAAGFDRVFVTIVDTHVASLIAAAFLFQFGTGPIRGFATTLFFGLLANVFTAVFVSRTMFELFLSRRPVGEARLSI
jgi:preprotein translocase subunit SecD